MTPEEILEGKIPLQTHLKELRYRLLLYVTVLFVAFAGCYFISDWLFALLAAPLLNVLGPDRGMIFTHVTEGFFVFVKTSFFWAFCVTFPFGLYQIWAFVRPGLFQKEQISLRSLLAAVPILFYSGMLFAYTVVIPHAISFFLSFESQAMALPLRLEARLSEYFSLIQQFLFAFGFCFLTPVVLVGLGRLGMVHKAALQKSRKFVFVGILVIAAFLTPPDVMSQIMLAVPMYLLFEGAIYFIGEKKEKETDA